MVELRMREYEMGRVVVVVVLDTSHGTASHNTEPHLQCTAPHLHYCLHC